VTQSLLPTVWSCPVEVAILGAYLGRVTASGEG
jgi:hypothetical protein